jgi:hypothetical protein
MPGLNERRQKAGKDLSAGRVVRGDRSDSGLHFFRAQFKVVTSAKK